MLKQFLIGFVLLISAHFSLAAVDVNSADKASLQSIKDVSPATADAILAERQKGGKFKNWDDLVKRVKGVGPRNSVKMSEAGMTVDGAAKPALPAKAMPTDKKAMAKNGKDIVEKDNKDAKPAKTSAPSDKMGPVPTDKPKEPKVDIKKDDAKK